MESLSWTIFQPVMLLRSRRVSKFWWGMSGMKLSRNLRLSRAMLLFILLRVAPFHVPFRIQQVHSM